MADGLTSPDNDKRFHSTADGQTSPDTLSTPDNFGARSPWGETIAEAAARTSKWIIDNNIHVDFDPTDLLLLERAEAKQRFEGVTPIDGLFNRTGPELLDLMEGIGALLDHQDQAQGRGLQGGLTADGRVIPYRRTRNFLTNQRVALLDNSEV